MVFWMCFDSLNFTFECCSLGRRRRRRRQMEFENVWNLERMYVKLNVYRFGSKFPNLKLQESFSKFMNHISKFHLHCTLVTAKTIERCHCLEENKGVSCVSFS